MPLGDKKVLDRIRVKKTKDLTKWALVIQNFRDQHGLAVSRDIDCVGPLAPLPYKKVVADMAWPCPLTNRVNLLANFDFMIFEQFLWPSGIHNIPPIDDYWLVVVKLSIISYYEPHMA